jgi:hypothetical protein
VGNHLRDIHKITTPTDRGKAVYASRNGLAEIFNKITPFKPAVFHTALVEFILRDRIPFLEVESLQFRNIVKSLRPEAVNHIPKSANTVREWSLDYYQAAKEVIKNQLQNAVSKIHISCDMWSSPNGHAFLGVVAHWTDEKYVLQTALIGLPKVKGQHTGTNIAKSLIDVLEQYNICDKAGYMMLDNASNNDTTVEAIHYELLARGITPTITPLERRLRCMGHIMNLVVKALLFGREKVALETTVEEITAWRKVGPIGKLHNLVRYIRASPQRREKFLQLQLETLQAVEAFMVRQNNDTRWNSTHDMIERALQLRGAIDQFIVAAIADQGPSTPVGERLDHDQLSAADWDDLETLMKLLNPFKEVTMDLQGNIRGEKMNGAVFDVLPAMDMLLQQLEVAKTAYQQRKSPFATCINLAWMKLDEYYSKTDTSPIYVASVILDPRLKLRYFEQKWLMHQDWIDRARSEVDRMYNQYRDQLDVDSPDVASASTEPTLSTLVNWKFGAHILVVAWNELEVYLSERSEHPTVSPREWWINNRFKFPVLAKMAWDILSIPAMSAEVERVFSGYSLFKEQTDLVPN